MHRFQEIADELATLIDKRLLRVGDRIPSVRSATHKHHVSPSTVIRAYQDLEARGLIESRARSGYFVRGRGPKRLAEPTQFKAIRNSTPVDVNDLIFEVFDAIKEAAVIQFGSAFVNPELFPIEMSSAGAAAARALKPAAIFEDLPPGNPELRRLIALRYLDTGSVVAADGIVITTGALEAISLCLRSVTRPGDTVAIETPTFFPILQMLEWMGLRAT